MIWSKLIATFLWCFVAVTHLTAASSAPNVIFIMTDDLGINDLSCYGRKDHRTPNLDRLAQQGIRFTSAYCAQPICSPSRAAFFTGKTPARLHLTTFLPGRTNAPSQLVLHPEMRQALPLEEITLAERLKKAGYTTACIGKWHLGGKGFLPTDQGFDVYYQGNANTEPSETEGGKGEYDLTAKAEEFLEQNREKPFFLFLSHNTPHITYSAKPELVQKNSNAFEPVYAALMETMDDAVGRIMKKVEKLGLTQNTIFIFTSDNGGLHVPEGKHAKVTYNAPFRAGKGFLYEGGLRIPLIVRWPAKIKPAQVIDTPVVNTDWVPTFLELLQINTTDIFDGQSIAKLLLNGTSSAERTFYWHFPHYSNQGGRPGGALRKENYKLIEFYDTGEIELYDLQSDIGEKQNFAGQHQQLAARLQKELKQWRQEVGAQENRPNPKADEALFRKLYVEMDPSRYEPEKADDTTLSRILEWRKGMGRATRQ